MSPAFTPKTPSAQLHRALNATEIVARLAQTSGWRLTGNGADLAIEKTCSFNNYFETMAFVNAVAFVAHTQDHHPSLQVTYRECTVRYNSHDIQGLSERDFVCAAHIDALLA